MMLQVPRQPAVLDLVPAPTIPPGSMRRNRPVPTTSLNKRAGAVPGPRRRSCRHLPRRQNGAYSFSLDSGDTGTLGTLLVLLTGRPGLPSPPAFDHQLEVVVAREFRAARPDLPKTVLIGQLVGLDAAHSRARR